MQKLSYCIHCGLSVERFGKYSKGDDALLPPLARYLWNVRLCEALYPTLGCVEVGMRNSIHRSFTSEYGPLWFDTPDLLGELEIKSLEAAKRELSKAHKPLTPEGIVAELNFGFWTALMSRRHMSDDPSNKGDYLKPWPRLLRSTFPHIPKQELTRSKLSVPLNKVRVLRNRVSHHEPIWHQQDLWGTYRDAKRLGEWLSPAMAAVTDTVDRFPEVYDGGSLVYHKGLEDLAGWAL